MTWTPDGSALVFGTERGAVIVSSSRWFLDFLLEDVTDGDDDDDIILYIYVVQNAAKSAECDWFWAASVTSEKFIGAPCQSNERYPAAKPRSRLRSVALTAPVIERITKNGKPTVTERLGRTKLKLQRAITAKSIAEDSIQL